MLVLDTGDPVAVALVAAIHTGATDVIAWLREHHAKTAAELGR